MSILFLEQSGHQDSIHPFDLRDQGLLLADGVFDTSLIVRGNMILREAHIHRLIADATALGIMIDHRKINTLLDQLLTEDHHGVCRITVTSGPTKRWTVTPPSAHPTIFLDISALNRKDQFTPLSLQVSSIRRNETSLTSQHKTLAYTDNIVALRVARDEGYDDALFLNTIGHVCCSTTANLFLKLGDRWVTPPISDGVLSGVMRQWILETGPKMGLEVIERSIEENELLVVESAFTTNSVRLVSPISNINEQDLQPHLPVGLKYAITKLIHTPY